MSVNASRLLWFHAFDRGSAGQIAAVLRAGPRPNPNPSSGTRQNESLLGIQDACVYAYLGRTIEAFGKCAVALQLDAMQGEVLPFDTGGLVRHIWPVCDWPIDAKRQLLAGHSWASTELAALLARYPGAAVRRYLNGDCPPEEGPHECLPVNGITASIWSGAGNSWRAWTWEGRSSNRLWAGDRLVAWSCRPDEYAAILMELPDAVTDHEAEELGLLVTVSKYRPGGVSALVANLRAAQEAEGG